jgi:hypothetical protein
VEAGARQLKEREATRDEWLDGVKVHRLRPGTSYVNLGEQEMRSSAARLENSVS